MLDCLGVYCNFYEYFFSFYINHTCTSRHLKKIFYCYFWKFVFCRKNSGFCRDGVFTLTTDFNNGAVPCQCDIDGSLSFNCSQYGGQCQCRQNVIGRECSRCEEGYYGFPRCTSMSLQSQWHGVWWFCMNPPPLTTKNY